MRVDLQRDNVEVFLVSDVVPREEIVKSSGKVESFYPRIVKPVIDRVIAALALIFFAPFMIVVLIMILSTEKGPVLFRHKRIGKGGQPFYCLKFRTMAVDADARLSKLLESDPSARAEWAASRKLTNDPRVTCLGALLRKTSLDELPQLWNVMRGDMSVVGPRPIVEAELQYYGEDVCSYLAVKPGITGLWQVSGRSDTTYKERVALDLQYASSRALWLDLWIILKTIKTVLLREGAR